MDFSGITLRKPMRVSRECCTVCVSPMMDNKFFTPEEEEILIDLISEYPPLYSHKDEAFKDKELKATIWKKIADSLGKNEETCKTKWKNLRDYYNKKKRVATLTTGSSGNSRKYDRYLKMKFLEESDPRSTNNVDTITVSEEENTQEEYEHPSMKDISLEYDRNISVTVDDPDGALEESSQPYKKAKVSSNNRSPRHRILMEYLQASGERMEMNDEIQSSKNIIMYDDSNETPPYTTFATAHGDPVEDFFRGIITTVKTFSPELQLRAKRSISNVVFDLEQEALSSNTDSPDIMIGNGR